MDQGRLSPRSFSAILKDLGNPSLSSSRRNSITGSSSVSTSPNWTSYLTRRSSSTTTANGTNNNRNNMDRDDYGSNGNFNSTVLLSDRFEDFTRNLELARSIAYSGSRPTNNNNKDNNNNLTMNTDRLFAMGCARFDKLGWNQELNKIVENVNSSTCDKLAMMLEIAFDKLEEKQMQRKGPMMYDVGVSPFGTTANTIANTTATTATAVLNSKVVARSLNDDLMYASSRPQENETPPEFVVEYYNPQVEDLNSLKQRMEISLNELDQVVGSLAKNCHYIEGTNVNNDDGSHGGKNDDDGTVLKYQPEKTWIETSAEYHPPSFVNSSNNHSKQETDQGLDDSLENKKEQPINDEEVGGEEEEDEEETEKQKAYRYDEYMAQRNRQSHSQSQPHYYYQQQQQHQEPQPDHYYYHQQQLRYQQERDFSPSSQRYQQQQQQPHRDTSPSPMQHVQFKSHPPRPPLPPSPSLLKPTFSSSMRSSSRDSSPNNNNMTRLRDSVFKSNMSSSSRSASSSGRNSPVDRSSDSSTPRKYQQQQHAPYQSSPLASSTPLLAKFKKTLHDIDPTLWNKIKRG